MIGSWKSNMLNLWDPPFPFTAWFLKNLKNLWLFQTWLQSQNTFWGQFLNYCFLNFFLHCVCMYSLYSDPRFSRYSTLGMLVAFFSCFSVCFSAVFTTNLNIFAVKTDEKQNEKQAKNSYCEPPPPRILEKLLKNNFQMSPAWRLLFNSTRSCTPGVYNTLCVFPL